MNRKLLIVSLLIFMLTGISTSSFFLSGYLTKVITENKQTKEQLNFAIALKNLTALEYALTRSELHSEQWLSLAKILAKTQGNVAYQLAIYYQNIQSKNIFWLKNASRLGEHHATLALAKYFFNQNNFIKAAEVLSRVPSDRANNLNNINLEALILTVNMAIVQGKTADIEHIITQNEQLLTASKLGQLLLNDIEKYKILAANNTTSGFAKDILHCENSIQLFATKLSHLKQVEKIIEEFQTQPLNNAVCFAPVRYIPINVLECNQNKNTAIYCNEQQWKLFAHSINTRYVGIMLPEGGANVHLGVLYFDSQDSVAVVAHEISHLLGFVDEYPLKAEHITCQYPQKEIFSQNIAVLKNTYQGDQKTIRAHVLKQLAWGKYIKTSTPILQSIPSSDSNKHWRLGTPKAFKHEIGVFNAQTCDDAKMRQDNNFSAYKGVADSTQLQYFSLTFPRLYMQLLQENGIDYRAPSFHYNIALAYFQQTLVVSSANEQASSYEKNISQANYWLEQAAKWENDPARHKKIRQGNF